MPSSSLASDATSECSASPASTRKRRYAEVEISERSSGQGDISDASSADEEDSDAPQPLPAAESTVLSHAERRRQKKKQKLNQLASTADSSESASKKRKLDESTDASPSSDVHAKTKTKTNAAAADDPRRQKRQHSVWVGNLSFRTTQDALRGFFDGVGTITRVHMPMRRGGQVQAENMGFAYIDFDTPEAKVTAITLSEGHLDGRKLLIKDGDDFTGRPAKAKTGAFEGTGGDGEGNGKPEMIKADGKGLSKTAQKILCTQKQPPAPTLFLGNLGFETTEESIRELFKAHRYWRHKDRDNGADAKEGERDESEHEQATSKDVWIRKVRMGTFEDSGACKGFAFVDFTSIEHATEALVNPRNHRLNGRDLVVEYASPDAVRRGGGPRHPKGDRDQKNRSGSDKGTANAPYTKQRRPQQPHVEREDDGDAGKILAEPTMAPRSRGLDHATHDRSHVRRTRPGAALAHAPRQSAAIIPGKGQKIVF